MTPFLNIPDAACSHALPCKAKAPLERSRERAQPRTALVAQVSKPAVSPISKSAGAAEFRARATNWSVSAGRTRRGFGNPRHSRLGSLRYRSRQRPQPRTALVAQVSEPAVSPISKSAGATQFRARAANWSVAGGRTRRGFGNPRHSRLGILRYRADATPDASARPHRSRSARIGWFTPAPLHPFNSSTV